MLIKTENGTEEVTPIKVIEDFAIIENQGELAPFYTITHVPSGLRMPSISRDGGETIAVHITPESCEAFLLRALDELQPGDIWQDNTGWHVSARFRKAYQRLVQREFDD